MNFKKWLDVFLEEKGIDDYQEIEIEDEGAWHYMVVKNVKEFINQLPEEQQVKIKNTFIKIDFQNGDVINFITYLANRITKI